MVWSPLRRWERALTVGRGEAEPVPLGGLTRIFIEILVFAAAEAAVLFRDVVEPFSAQRITAGALIALYVVLGFPAVRRGLPPLIAGLIDFTLIVTLACLQIEMSALVFLIVGSAFRNGSSLPNRTWLVFVAVNVAVLVVAVLLSAHYGRHPRTWFLWTASYACVALVLVLTAIRYGNSARAAFIALSEAHVKLQRRSVHVAEVAALRERERIALDLHDSLGHELTTLALQIEAARLYATTAHADGRIAVQLSQAHGTTLAVLASVRRSVSDLSKDPLEREDLHVALQRVCRRFEKASGIPLALSIAPMPPLAPATVTDALNIAREALTNIGRHARAGHIAVRAGVEGDAVVIEVADDGVGFDPQANRSGNGLSGMRSRARSLGASFDVRTSPGDGCAIVLRVPLAAEVPA